ncbi:hypothetical protein, partial [Streptomyces virens]|uniref:hypothetical protein n=1 Tax=Streptomyces virens TaxID=285572 RepID=UPI0031F9ACB9
AWPSAWSVDPETGEWDTDVIETGNAKSQRDRKKTLMNIFRSYWNDPDYKYGAPLPEVIQDADAVDIDESTLRSEIESLENQREVYTFENQGDTIINEC